MCFSFFAFSSLFFSQFSLTFFLPSSKEAKSNVFVNDDGTSKGQSSGTPCSEITGRNCCLLCCPCSSSCVSHCCVVLCAFSRLSAFKQSPCGSVSCTLLGSWHSCALGSRCDSSVHVLCAHRLHSRHCFAATTSRRKQPQKTRQGLQCMRII